MKVNVSEFGAKGNGTTNDRKSIQEAIDFVYSNGGGEVEFSPDTTYLTSGIVIKSNVTLKLNDGTVLLQDNDSSTYVKPVGDGYEKYDVIFGHNYDEKIKWSHVWYKNYPFIYAPEYSHDFAVKGNGTLIMAQCDDTNKTVKTCPIGFYHADNFEISDITIKNYHGYALMPFTSSNGLFSNLKISDWTHGNGDGICLMNCRNIRITGCRMFTGDDAVYIFSSYRDPRKSEWWSSDEPQASENIEIDHNDLITNHCKAFGMILWGIDCPDPEKIEVRNVYVHHNHFETMGVWLFNPYTDRGGNPPVTSVRFEDNIIDGIECNFFETAISDMNYYHSMTRFENGSFQLGRCFWAMKKNSDENCVGVDEDENGKYGYIRSFEKGNTALYQGIYIEKNSKADFRAKVRTENAECRLFVRDTDTDEIIASVSFDNPEWEAKELKFNIQKSGNYRIGIENGNAKSGKAFIKNANLGMNPDAFGYEDVIFDNGKMIFKYNDNLFGRDR